MILAHWVWGGGWAMLNAPDAGACPSLIGFAASHLIIGNTVGE
jgi:hypothetical protein